jgi:hypothetical protein
MKSEAHDVPRLIILSRKLGQAEHALALTNKFSVGINIPFADLAQGVIEGIIDFPG